MSTLKIAIADPDPEFWDLLEGCIRSNTNTDLGENTASQLVEQIRGKKPNVLIIDVAADHTRALPSRFSKESRPLRAFPHVSGNVVVPAASAWTDSSSAGSRCQSTTRNSCIRKKAAPGPAAEADREDDLRISNLLHQLGIPFHIKGYHYLRDAIKLVLKNPEAMDAVTKVLYPEIAKRYNTSASCVERAMRNAIEIAWDRGNMEYLHQRFGRSVKPMTTRPTNSEFIATAVDMLRLQQAQPELLPCV